MTSFDKALELILRRIKPLAAERVDTLESIGRVTAEDTMAPCDLPVFDNSAMDGYAVRAEDCEIAALVIDGFIPAGREKLPQLKPGTAIRIMTGAPVPQYADAVIPLEDVEDTSGHIHPLKAVNRGQHIRRAGEDIKQGTKIIPGGTFIGSPEMNLLVAMGLTSVRAHKKPVVAILATGDELVPLGSLLSRGKIVDSNSAMLAAAVTNAGATPVMLGIARDNRESLREKLAIGLQTDALITAAGVSVGDFDLVREVLAALGAEEVFWGIDMKPGKAAAFSWLDGKPVFSLPGNPVSAFVTFEELVRPALLSMGGRRAVMRPLVAAVLQEPLRKKPGRVLFARVKVKVQVGKLLVWSSGPQDTGRQSSLLQTDAMAVLAADRTSFDAGEEIRVHILADSFCMIGIDEGLRELSLALEPEGVTELAH